MTVDIKLLDSVIEQTITTVEKSENQIFEIAEQARKECENLRQEVKDVQNKVLLLIEKGDELERSLKLARIRLSKVSENFKSFSENDIREAYENANRIQLDLILTQEKEKQLRKNRDDLQLRLRNLEQTVGKAESLMTQMGVVLGYLTGDIKRVGKYIEDTQHQHKMGLQVIQAQEEERKRVAREIHDGPAQSMANVVLRTELVEKVLLQEGIEKAIDELKELKATVRDSLGDVRRIIFDLRPMALDDLGLVPTVHKYVDRVNEKSLTQFQFKTFGKEIRLPNALEVTLFRLIQESLTNISKHAKAKYADIKLEFQKEQIYLIIKDNGVGFEMNDQKLVGYGILGMKERVKLLNGKIIIQSYSQRGTKIILSIPI